MFFHNIGGTAYVATTYSANTDKQRLVPSAMAPGRYTYTTDNERKWNATDTDRLTLNMGYNVTTISYRNGDTSYISSNITQERFLAGRDSDTGNHDDLSQCPSYYGEAWDGTVLGQYGENYGQWNWRNINVVSSTARWLDGVSNNWGPESADPTADTDSLVVLVDRTIADKGYFRNFTHFHDIANAGKLDRMIDSIRSRIDAAGVFPYTGGAQSITEYATMRTMARAANSYKVDFRDSSVYIRMDIDTTDWPYHLVYEKVLSIPVNLSGSNLAGQDIACTGCAGIREVSADNYVIDLQWSGSNTRAAAVLTPTASPDYYDFTRPTGSVSLDGTTATLTCDDCTAVVYQSSSTSYLNISTYIYRAQAYSDTHTFTVSPGTNYFLGLKSRTGQLTLIAYNP